MGSFESIINLLPSYMEKLLLEKEFLLAELTERTIRDYFCSEYPVAGVFVMFEKGIPVYIGRSRTLAQRIGVDLRSTQKSQATLTFKLLKSESMETMEEARDYMYKHFTVKMLQLEDEYDRAVFQIYATMRLNTKYNSFVES